MLGIDPETMQEYTDWLAEQREQQIVDSTDYYDTLIDIALWKLGIIRDKEMEHLRAKQKMWREAGFALKNIWDSAFSNLFDSTRKGSQNIALAMLEGLIGTLSMAIDSMTKRIVAKWIGVKAELLMESLTNPVALAKIAIGSAIAGAAKAGLNRILEGARSSMEAYVPRYQYGGVVPETGLALVHEGEHIFNPAYPVDSLHNMGAAITFKQVINGNIDRDELDAANESFVDYLYSRRLAKGLS